MQFDATIDSILNRYAFERKSARVEALGAAGGLSGALIWRITTPQCEFALRRWPREHPTPERLTWIHSMLRHASEHGFPSLPVPIATRDGQSFFKENDHLWELAPWMPGVADFERDPRIEKLLSAMYALAQFHLAVADFNTAPPGIPHASSAIMRRIARLSVPHPDGALGLEHAITESIWPALAPLAREFTAALPKAALRAMALLEPASRAPQTLQPCLRDIWHDHILFTGDEVTGIIDFGAAHIDTPATDVARLLGSLVGDDRALWQSGLAAYESIRPLSDHERNAIPGLDASGIVIALCNWIRWIYIERRQFENRQQVVDRFARLLNRMRIL